MVLALSGPSWSIEASGEAAVEALGRTPEDYGRLIREKEPPERASSTRLVVTTMTRGTGGTAAAEARHEGNGRGPSRLPGGYFTLTVYR